MISHNTLSLFSVLLLCACTGRQQPADVSNNPSAEKYLDLTLEAEQWLSSHSLDSTGIVLPDAIDQPEEITTSYSDGMAGQLTFYLDLYKATNEAIFLSKAEGIGWYLIDHLPKKTDPLKGGFWAFSTYGAVGGPTFALAELYKATKNEVYKNEALKVLDVLAHFADETEDSISWDAGNDVLGGLSGTGLLLLYAHRELKAPAALQMATKAGHTLLARAREENGGLTWKRGQSSRFILPNFSHGAAGIGYFFASLYEATKDELFLEAVLKSVTYLDAVAMTEGGVYLIPYGFPDAGWNRAFDIGWAHGPAGVARLFIKLHKITGDTAWLEKARACYRGILLSNPMGKPADGFGEEPFGIDQRFGLAGVARFVQDMYSYTGDEEYLKYSEKLVAFILSKSQQNNGLYWPQSRFSFMANAGEETVFSGRFYGNTGFAALLLQQYQVMNGKTGVIRFVDDPF